MGYACPVCSDPQADAGHLANHLAFTAILGDDEHEMWLDDHASGWNEMNERELATVVSERVEETEFPRIFDDTAGGLESESEPGDPLSERSGALFDEHQHGRTHSHARGETHPGGGTDMAGPFDAETEAVLEEAKELTRQMLTDDEEAEE